MKHCPTCNHDFNDDTLSFCLEDGTPLVTVDAGPDSEATVVSPSPQPTSGSGLQETQAYNQLPGRPTWAGSLQSPGPPPSYTPPPAPRKIWPWVVGIGVFLLLGLGIIVAAVIIIPQIANPSPNANRPVPSPTPFASPTEEPSPSPVESPSIEVSDVPTDPAEVKSDLSDLEDEWSEANIKGDKSAIARILADDYVGGNGSTQHGKQQYIRDLKPDPTVTDWNIKDLDVTLKGDRATVHGVLTLERTKGTETYRFTDTFVWRDHRWQAVGSITTAVQ